MTSYVYDLDGNRLNVSALLRRQFTKEQWFQELEVRPATQNQIGNLMSLFNSLGFTEEDRAERLEVISWLIGRDITSTTELKQGEAGLLVKLLKNVRTPDELYDLLPDEYWQEEDRKPWIGIVLIIGGLALALL
jgi:hypothetical protein